MEADRYWELSSFRPELCAERKDVLKVLMVAMREPANWKLRASLACPSVCLSCSQLPLFSCVPVLYYLTSVPVTHFLCPFCSFAIPLLQGLAQGHLHQNACRGLSQTLLRAIKLQILLDLETFPYSIACSSVKVRVGVYCAEPQPSRLRTPCCTTHWPALTKATG